MINSDKELLDLAVALREENRALKSLVRAVANEIKMTVRFPANENWSHDVVLQKETIAKLLDLGGDDVGRRSRKTKRGTGSEEKRGAGKN